MRILVISDLPQFVTGGAEMQAFKLIEAWLEAGHDVVCLGRRLRDGHIAIGSRRLTIRRIRAAQRLGRWVRGASYFISVVLLVLRNRRWADAIYVRFLGEAAVTVALLKKVRLVRVPLIATPANTRGRGDLAFLKSVPFWPWLVRLLDAHCDAINLIAEGMVRELLDAGFSGRNFERIPNGVRVSPLGERNPSARRSFLSVGRLARQKGFDILLHALARLPADAEAEVRIAGDGPEREELAALATRLGLGDRVRWLGELSSSDVARELTRAQAFVLASRYEGLTNAGLEAMERGVPVILTRCGGLDQYVNERIGWVVPPEDVEALASVLLQAFSMDAQELARMGDQARKLVESNFDIRIIASRYIDLFQRCVAAPR